MHLSSILRFWIAWNFETGFVFSIFALLHRLCVLSG